MFRAWVRVSNSLVVLLMKADALFCVLVHKDTQESVYLIFPESVFKGWKF